MKIPLKVKNSEVIGILTESILCEINNIEFNTTRKKKCMLSSGCYDYLSKDLKNTMKLYFYKDSPYNFCDHVGSFNGDCDFIDVSGRKVSLKTNISGNKICPQNIGQSTLNSLSNKIGLLRTIENNNDYKKIVMSSKIIKLLDVYIANLFCCDIMIYVQYNKGKVYILKKDNKDINFDICIEKISFSRTLENWNESNTFYSIIDNKKIPIAEFQIHNKRNSIKCRFNFDSILKIINSGNLKGIKVEELQLTNTFDIKITKIDDASIVLPKKEHPNYLKTPFRTFNYIGSKYKLLDFLIQSIQGYTGKTIKELSSFGDLFCGTGVVTERFIKEGANTIVSSDIQYYSAVVSSVFTDKNIDKIKIKNIIIELNNLPLREPLESDFIYHNYSVSRFYLTKENALKTDIIRQRIEELKQSITDEEYNILLKTLLYAVIKVSNVASVFGAFLKTYKKSSKADIHLENFFIENLINYDISCEFNTYCSNIYDILECTLDLNVVYLDPPYNSRNYSSNYHLLETIAKYDYPNIKGVTGLREEPQENSKLFCMKKSAYSEFEKLISCIKSKYIFMSYNSEGILLKEDIIEILSLTRSNVVCVETEYKKFNSGNNIDDEHSVIEYIFCCS
jgi:adenine-specific DNA-methyltransferase